MLRPGLLLLGIDIGGTKIGFSVGDETGKIHRRLRRTTQLSGSAETDLRRVAAEARHLIGAAGARPEELAAVGAAVPGPLDLDAGLVLNPPNLPSWDRAPVREVLAEELGCPVFLENDANAAALAEWRFGAGRGFSHLVYLTIPAKLAPRNSKRSTGKQVSFLDSSHSSISRAKYPPKDRVRLSGLPRCPGRLGLLPIVRGVVDFVILHFP